MVRRATNDLLFLVEQKVIDKDVLIAACLDYMSEDEVADMAHTNGFIEEEEEG